MSIFQLPLYSSTTTAKPTAASADDEEDEAPHEQHNTTQKNHRSQRYEHLGVLVTIVHKKVIDQQWEQAFRAFSMLIRCNNVDIRLCWEQGLAILEHIDTSGEKAAEFLSRLIVAYPPVKPRRGRQYDRADTFVRVLTKHRIKHEQWDLSRQEVESWILVPPYKDDRKLWEYLARIYEHLLETAVQDGSRSEARRLTEALQKVNAALLEKRDASIYVVE